MNANIKNIIIPVNQLYSLLDLAVYLYLLKTSEPSYAMVDMNNIITRIQPCELLNRYALFFCEISSYSEFVIPVEYLVIGKN